MKTNKYQQTVAKGLCFSFQQEWKINSLTILWLYQWNSQCIATKWKFINILVTSIKRFRLDSLSHLQIFCDIVKVNFYFLYFFSSSVKKINVYHLKYLCYYQQQCYLYMYIIIIIIGRNKNNLFLVPNITKDWFWFLSSRNYYILIFKIMLNICSKALYIIITFIIII